MTETRHPNASLLMKLDIQNLDACKRIFADNFVWHYFNPKLPELEGDHCGIEGLKNFFAKLSERARPEDRFAVDVGCRAEAYGDIAEGDMNDLASEAGLG